MKLYLYLPGGHPAATDPSRLGDVRLASSPETARRVAERYQEPTDSLVCYEIDEENQLHVLPLYFDNELMFDPSWIPVAERAELLAEFVHDLDPGACTDAVIQIDQYSWWLSVRITGTCLSLGGDPGWTATLLLKEEIEQRGDAGQKPSPQGPASTGRKLPRSFNSM